MLELHSPWARIPGPTSFDAKGASSTALLGRLCSREKRLGLAPEELQLLEHFKDLLVRVTPPPRCESFHVAVLAIYLTTVSGAQSKLLVFSPSQRMTAAAALRHPFFTEPDPPKVDKSQVNTQQAAPKRVRVGRGFN